jgi:hypothetical protein
LPGEQFLAREVVELPEFLVADLLRATVEEDAAPAHPHQARKELPRQAEVVQAHHQGESTLDRDVGEQRHGIAGACRIDRGDRLVREQCRRLLHERTGDGHALALSAGESVAALEELLRDADALEQVMGAGKVAPRREEQGA